MRARTFILLILVLLVAAAAVVLVVLFGGGLDVVTDLLPGGEDAVPDIDEEEAEPVEPTPTATPEHNFVPVVVARIAMPPGTQIEEDFLVIERRPDTNIAISAGYVFQNREDVVDRITRTRIEPGQAILNSMLAVSPTDIASMGSDLANYVNQGSVAVAFPINRYSGAAYAMRPGDLVDVLGSLSFIDIDPEFQTARPNFLQLVDEQILEEGGSFLFERIAQGRLEFIPELSLTASIGPGGQSEWDGSELLQIPRRVTQLTIQQAEVLWVGTWEHPGDLTEGEAPAGPAAPPAEQEQQQEEGEQQQQPTGQQQPGPQATPSPLFERRERAPDVVILSMPLQDALALKWAMDRGLEMDLALRSQGDNSVFITTAVSLPQLVEQGGLNIPEPLDFGLEPRADEVEPPSIPPNPPGP
ncbi:MAG: hypothetical protein R3248_01330 [Candidatus Promineifilaceae bacterium]|nr:hypothetical protein [Candidatus Promineifilaceae bacterium]